MEYARHKKLKDSLKNSNIPKESFERALTSIVGEKISEEIKNEFCEVDLGFERRLFKDLINDILIESINGMFVAITKFEESSDLQVLKKLYQAKSAGVYIIFNNDAFYVGQSVNMIDRFYSHSKDPKKEINNGRIIFFGRENGSLGKDQLDYIERYMIERLKRTERRAINGDNGNASFQSESNKISSDYLLSTMYQIVSKSSLNPFIRQENTIREYEREIFESYTREINKNSLKYSEIISSRLNYGVTLLEFEFDSSGIAKPIDINQSDALYNSIRDGLIPEDEIEGFIDYLEIEYIRRIQSKYL